MKNLKKGFTLIELLVVVAIIGILASVVLASLNSARNKGKDASASASISSVRAAAEIYYTIGSTYNVSATDNVCEDADVAKLLTAAGTQTGGTAVCNSAATVYAASVPLLEANKYFCVDSTGVAGKTGTALGTATACTIS